MTKDGDRQIDEILGAGSAGPGKSYVLLRDPLFQMLREHQRMLLPPDHPHWLPPGGSTGYALLLRRTMPMIRDLINQSKTVYPRWDPGAEYAAGTFTWRFTSGYRIEFGHCKDTDDWERYQGAGKTWLGFDELIHFDEEQYQNLKMWVRSSDPVLSNDLRIRAASNPFFKKERGDDFTVKNPFWVRDYFVEPYPEGNVIIREKGEHGGEEFERTRLYMPAKLSDNPDPVFRRRYMSKLVFALPHIKKALIEGDWYATPGGYFEGTWDPDIHTIERFRIPVDWKVWRAMDWGYKTQGVVLWFTYDPDGNMIIFREFNFIEMVDKAVAERIREIETEMGLWYKGRSLITGPADTQIWEERGDSGVTKAQVFLQHGIRWKPATKERHANAQAITKLLKDHNNYSRKPGLMIFKSCQKTVQHFPNIAADPKDPETPIKGGMDHWYDTVSYGVRYAERGPQVVQDHEAMRRMIDKMDSVDDIENTGRDGYGGY